jgi:hypothetical protein
VAAKKKPVKNPNDPQKLLEVLHDNVDTLYANLTELTNLVRQTRAEMLEQFQYIYNDLSKLRQAKDEESNDEEEEVEPQDNVLYVVQATRRYKSPLPGSKATKCAKPPKLPVLYFAGTWNDTQSWVQNPNEAVRFTTFQQAERTVEILDNNEIVPHGGYNHLEAVVIDLSDDEEDDD